MASPPWFYYPFTDFEQSSIELSGAEVNHILGARRLRAGDQLVLMNGKGALAHCLLEQADKSARRIRVQVTLMAELAAAQTRIILACALPKGDHLSDMLDMACQLGISDFMPLQFEHSVTRWNAKLQARCQRIVLEACKQSKRAWLPRVHDIQPFSVWLEKTLDEGVFRVLADQNGQPMHSWQAAIAQANSVVLIVGPEGGLSNTELSQIQTSKMATVRLAEPILRIETAAIAGIAALNQTGYTV